ncbi:MAG: hypothetical protein ACLTSZ_01670 [Lachnospiraceae bacterium]
MQEGYWSMAMIPILMLIILAYYGVRLLVLHDISAIRGKDQPGKLKDEGALCKGGGQAHAVSGGWLAGYDSVALFSGDCSGRTDRRVDYCV